MNRNLSKFSDAFSFVQEEVGERFPAPLLKTLLLLAEKPGITSTEIAERLQLPKQTVSRYFIFLSKGKIGETGMGLITTEEDPYDTRKKISKLTTKGERFLSRIADILT